MVVVRPVGDGAQGGAGGEDVGRGEEGHERDEAAVAAAVDADAFGVDAVLGDEPLRGIDVVVEIDAAHVPVDGGAPVAAIAGRGAVVDVEDQIAALASAGDGTCTRGSSSTSRDGRSADSPRRARRSRPVRRSSSPACRCAPAPTAVARGEVDDRHVEPRVASRTPERATSSRLRGVDEQLRRLVRVRVEIGQHACRPATASASCQPAVVVSFVSAPPATRERDRGGARTAIPGWWSGRSSCGRRRGSRRRLRTCRW